MLKNTFYPIGSANVPWTEQDKKCWFESNVKQRSYQDEVVTKLKTLPDDFELIQYGALSINPEAYPLFALKTKQWQPAKPSILITGGVHGYETSGVQGAIEFLKELDKNYLSHFNIVTLPCVSPWGYEHIVRWNPFAIDPNRSFIKQSPSEEANSVMQFIAKLETEFLMHIDLHETTDSDETEFRPALCARDGKEYHQESIPDGFYLVGDSENKQTEFQDEIIKAVSKVTHIAPADEKGEIIGSKAESEGVIYYPLTKLGLCASVTNAPYTTTTEVYPDSDKVTDTDCNNAQVSAIKAALNFIINKNT